MEFEIPVLVSYRKLQKIININMKCLPLFLLILIRKSVICQQNVTENNLVEQNRTQTEGNLRQSSIQEISAATEVISEETFNTKIIATILVSTALLLIIAIIISLICKNNLVAKCTKKLCRKNKQMPLLRQQYDKIEPGNMQESEFQQKAKIIFSCFENCVQKTKSNFSYRSYNEQSQNFCKVEIKAKKQAAFHYSIILEGEDKHGQFYSQGSILYKKEAIFLWFCLQYYDISKKWNSDRRIFVTQKSAPGLLMGKWFTLNHQGNEDYCGPWILSDNSVCPSNSEDRLQSVQQNL